MRWHIFGTMPNIDEMLENMSLRSLCPAQDSPEHRYVFFTPQIYPNFPNIRAQARSFVETKDVLNIVKFLLFRKKSKSGK